MKIVRASPNDCGELAEFARYTYEYAFGREIGCNALRLHLNEKMSDESFKQMLSVDKVYLSRSGSQLVGFVQVGGVNSNYAAHLEEFDYSGKEIRRLYVKPELQSQGVGSALLIRAINELIQAYSQNLYLTTWETNLGAQKLYRKHEFQQIGQIPEFDIEGKLNGYEYVMHRHLPPSV